MSIKYNINLGDWKHYPRYSVVGEPSDFYVWRSYDPTSHTQSGWIKGHINLYHGLKKARKKNGRTFMKMCDMVLEVNTK